MFDFIISNSCTTILVPFLSEYVSMLHCVVFRLSRDIDVKYILRKHHGAGSFIFLQHFYTSHDFVSVLYDNIPSYVFTETSLKHHSNSKPAQPALPAQPYLGCLSSEN